MVRGKHVGIHQERREKIRGPQGRDRAERHGDHGEQDHLARDELPQLCPGRPYGTQESELTASLPQHHGEGRGDDHENDDERRPAE